MERIEVDIDEEKMVSCGSCQVELFSLANISSYCRKGASYLLVNRNGLIERVRLSEPYLTNEQCFFLMHLQRVECGLCSQPLGFFFRTANLYNQSLLHQFFIDVAALKRGKMEEKAFGMMEQALISRLEQASNSREEDATFSIDAPPRETGEKQNEERNSEKKRSADTKKPVTVEELLFGVVGAYGYLREVRDRVTNKLDELLKRIEVVRRRLTLRAKKRRDSTPDLT